MNFQTITELIRNEGGVPGEYRGDGDSPPDLMIVGEAPGPTEQRTGRPFVGPAGKLLDAMLQEAGLHSYYITNRCKHFPGRDKDGKIRPPKVEEHEQWTWAIEAELGLVQPKTVLLLGAQACKLAFPGVWKMGELVGQSKEIEGVKYIAAYHPAAFLHNQGKAFNTRNMNQQKRILREIAGVQEVEYQYRVLEPYTYSGSLVIDLETPAETDPRTAHLTETSYLDPHEHEAVLSFEPSSLPPRPIAAIFHNAMFDYPLLCRYNPEWLNVPEIHDTMVMAYVLGYEDLSLKGLSNQLFGVKVYDYAQREQCGREIYNAQDVFLTRRLYEYLPQFIEGTAYDIDRSIIKLLTRASLFGGYEVDLTLLQKKIDDLEKEKARLEARWNSWYPGVNIGSPEQLLAVLPVQDTQKATLKELGTAAAALVLAWRERNTALTRYLKPKAHLSKLNGLFRLTLSAGDEKDDEEDAGTRSGRLSSHDDNLQNISPVIQPCLHAPRGYKLLRPDYSQIELRVMAEVTQDKNMLVALKEGSIHRETEEATKLPYKVAKTWNFNRWYWGAALADPEQLQIIARSFAKKYHMQKDECLRILKGQNDKYPAFIDWARQHWEKTRSTGFSVTPGPFLHKRKIHLQDAGKAMRQAGNHPIQGFATYIMKEALSEFGWEDDCQFVNTIHDELHYFVPTKDAKKWEKRVRECMIEVAQRYLPTVGVDVEVKCSKSWEPK